MNLYDPENSYRQRILAHNPIKRLRKLGHKDSLDLGLPGEIAILISSLREEDFDYLRTPINNLIVKSTPEVSSVIVGFIPVKKLCHFSKSISTRLFDLVDAIPQSELPHFAKVMVREIPKNNGNHAAKLIKHALKLGNLNFFVKAINQAIDAADARILENIITAIPAEEVANFIASIGEAIIKNGNKDIIHAVATKRCIEFFIEPISQRMINLAPTDIRHGIATEALGYIKAIPAELIHNFIESIRITIAKISGNIPKHLPGLSRACDKYVDSILKHVPERHRESVLGIADSMLVEDNSWVSYILKRDQMKGAQNISHS